MIKLDRSAAAIPASLNNPNTNTRRNELIANGGWIGQKRYETPYKGTDVRTALMLFSHNKCCFCEQILNIATSGTHRGDDFSREHFRAKSKYWWLAYSWDNLLPACKVCNGSKDDDFDINGTFRAYQATDLVNIHALTALYNTTEQHNYLHPEHGNDPETVLTFDANGQINSTNAQALNTIQAYKLYRVELQTLRKKIYDDFKTEYDLIQLSGKTEVDKRADISTLFRAFLTDSRDKNKPFLAFRRYILRNDVRNLILGITA
jgi:uncharacterized protein (TIGR02646 family)